MDGLTTSLMTTLKCQKSRSQQTLYGPLSNKLDVAPLTLSLQKTSWTGKTISKNAWRTTSKWSRLKTKSWGMQSKFMRSWTRRSSRNPYFLSLMNLNRAWIIQWVKFHPFKSRNNFLKELQALCQRVSCLNSHSGPLSQNKWHHF